MAAAEPAPVILVMEQPGQVTGSGCCGKLEGENCGMGNEDPFAGMQDEARSLVKRAQARAGELGTALEVVDGRNLVGLVIAYHRQVRQGGWPGLGAALRGYPGWFPVPCLIANGRVEKVDT